MQNYIRLYELIFDRVFDAAVTVRPVNPPGRPGYVFNAPHRSWCESGGPVCRGAPEPVIIIEGKYRFESRFHRN